MPSVENFPVKSRFLCRVGLAAPLLLAVAQCLLWTPPSALADTSLAELMPAGAVVYGEVSNLDRVIERVEQSDLVSFVVSTPQWKDYLASPDYQRALAGKRFLDAQLGGDSWVAAKKLLGRDFAVGLYPKPGKKEPDLVAILRAGDKETLGKIRQAVENVLLLFGGSGIDRATSAEGLVTVSLKGKAFYASKDDWVAFSTQRELLGKTTDLILGKKEKSVGTEERFRSVIKDAGSTVLARAYVDTQTLTKAAGKRFIPKKLDNVVSSMLLGGVFELAAENPGIGATLSLEANQVVLTFRLAGSTAKLPAIYQAFFSSPSGPGAAPIPAPAGTLLGFSLYRDFTALYKQREQLLEANLLPEFDKFETGLAGLLPGRNFAEDILPLLGRQMTIVVAKQDFGHLGGEPPVKLPGFALVIEPTKAEDAGNLFQLFFQTIITVLNFQVGERGGEPMVQSAERYHDVTIAFGKHLQRAGKGPLPFMFNFTPAVTRAGDRVILSSSLSLARQLVEQLQSATRSPGEASRNSDLVFAADAIADLLAANRSFFEGRIVQSGKSAARAKNEFDAGLSLIRRLKTYRVYSTVLPDAFVLQMEVRWK